MQKILFMLFALSLAVPARAESAGSLMAQADAAYALREDPTQAKNSLTAYEGCAQSAQAPDNPTPDRSTAVSCYWKASRAAWWLGEHDHARADRLADYQRGIDDARKAVALDPDSAAAHFWLGGNEGSFGDTKGIMKSLGMVKPIRHEMAEVLRLNDHYNNGSAYQVLGVVDYKVPGLMGGDKGRAKIELERALVMGPNDPFHVYYMAEYWKTVGHKEKLKEELDALKNLQPPSDLIPETKMLQARAETELK
jgi:tetratricopeptide (TPR) repeat protein